MHHVRRIQGGKIYVKPFNYIGALAVIAVGVLAYPGNTESGLVGYIMPAFFIFFGIIMIASDFNIQSIIKQCNFLDIYMGRGLFNIFVGSQITAIAYSTRAVIYAKDYNPTILQEAFATTALVTGYFVMGLGIYLVILHCLESNTSINGNIESAVQAAVTKHAVDTLSQRLNEEYTTSN